MPSCPTRQKSGLPQEPQSELSHSCAAARIARAQDAVIGNGCRVVRVIEDIKEVEVEPQRQPLLNAPPLEQGCILEPLPGSIHVLVSPGVQIVVEDLALHSAVT